MPLLVTAMLFSTKVLKTQREMPPNCATNCVVWCVVWCRVVVFDSIG